MLHCWLLALTKSQGTADIPLPDKFAHINPVGRDGEGEAGRVSCVSSGLGEGRVPVLDAVLVLLLVPLCIHMGWRPSQQLTHFFSSHASWKLTSSQTDLSTFITRNLWVIPKKLYSLCTNHLTRTAHTALTRVWLPARTSGDFLCLTMKVSCCLGSCISVIHREAVPTAGPSLPKEQHSCQRWKGQSLGRWDGSQTAQLEAEPEKRRQQNPAARTVLRVSIDVKVNASQQQARASPQACGLAKPPSTLQLLTNCCHLWLLPRHGTSPDGGYTGAKKPWKWRASKIY